MASGNESYVRLPSDLSSFEHQPVFVVRVAAHTLGRQEVGGKSENHLSIYLLLGRNVSFHMDIRPIGGQGDTVETTGCLYMQRRAYHLSNTVIKYTDLNALGCPEDFTPVGSFWPLGPYYTVRHYVDFVIGGGFHHFRYTFTDGHSVGCRHWA
jgi:hypothetical protein